MPHILALDQGTTSSRAILFDESSRIVATAQKEFEQIYPKPGWVEHDPEEIWSTQAGVATEALSRARLRPRDVAAIGVTNQRETVVLWDRVSGEPVHNAVVWQDRRTAGMCDRLKEQGASETIRRKTGLEIDAYFSATKIAWLLDNVEGLRPRAEAGDIAFGTIDSWLLWRLSDQRIHVTDVSNACRTLLYDIHSLDWDADLLELFDIPRSMMPEVRPSSGVFGECAGEGLAGVALAGVLGDQQAALAGQACFKEGMTKNTYGTGCFALINTGERPIESTHRLLTTIAWQIGDRLEYAIEGGVFVGGAVVQWLRDGLKIIRSAPEVEDLANSVEDNGGVYLVPAFAGLGAPHWDPYARGAIVGLTRGSTSGHIARAALEGICFEIADLLEAIQRDADRTIDELRVDGGAAANDTMIQLQADLLQIPMVRPKVIETTALGAAYMAGLATGVWKDTDDVAGRWSVDRRFEPKISKDEADFKRSRWADAVERAKDWARAEEGGADAAS